MAGEPGNETSAGTESDMDHYQHFFHLPHPQTLPNILTALINLAQVVHW